MNNVLMNIILGAVGSIVATVILYFCSHVYQVGYKDDFTFNLENALTAIYQIENHIRFPGDYYWVMSQIDNMCCCVWNMYRSLKPLSLWRNKTEKKLLITLLYDIIRLCEHAKCVAIGYCGEQEQEARINKLQRYFYRFQKTSQENASVTQIQLNVIQLLIKGKTISETFNEISHTYKKPLFENILEDGFIDINSLKSGRAVGIRKKCFCYCELVEVLKDYHYTE